MRKSHLAAGIAVLALLPSIAFAQSCEEQRSKQKGNTVAGAVIGGLAGSAVAGKDDRVAGALIGGTLGAVIGNQASKPDQDCRYAYGFYDENGVWHANAIDRTAARGYFDRDGRWVEGAPRGYYDSDRRWVAVNDSTSGYWDSNGRWVPVGAGGYYDANGRMVAGAASGYYDTSGRWIAGPVTGYYDSRGRWVSGSAPGRTVNGVWVADAAPGYYDSRGRWVAGPANGYYDSRGRWVSTAPSAGGYGTNVSYNDWWRDAPTDVRQRQDWMETRINNAFSNGRLTRMERDSALRELASIRADDRRLTRRHRGLTAADRDYLQDRLDTLAQQVRRDRRD